MNIDINTLCSLSRLALSDEERELLFGDLEKIVAFAKTVEGAKVFHNIEDCDGERKNAFRPDVPAAGESVDYTKSAEDSNGEYFCVPRAVE